MRARQIIQWTNVLCSLVLGLGLTLGALWVLGPYGTANAQVANPDFGMDSFHGAAINARGAAGQASPGAVITTPHPGSGVLPAPTPAPRRSLSVAPKLPPSAGAMPAAIGSEQPIIALSPPMVGNANLAVCLTTDRVWGVVGAGQRVTVTVDGVQMGAARADAKGFFWTTLYDASGERPTLSGGESLNIYRNGALSASVTLRSISGQVNSLSDVVSGTISGAPISATVYAPADRPLAVAYTRTVSTNGSGVFTADFSGIVDLWGDAFAVVSYIQSDVQVQREVYARELLVQPWPINAVMGFADPGATVTVTLLYPGGSTKEEVTGTAGRWRGDYRFDLSTDVLSGEVVVAQIGGSTTLSRAVVSLTVAVDAVNDRLTGQAPAGVQVSGRTSKLTPLGYSLVQTSATASSSGVYTLNFAGIADIMPGDWAGIDVLDAEGDALEMWMPAPSVEVDQTWNEVRGRGMAPFGLADGQPVTLTLYQAGSHTTSSYSKGLEGWYEWYQFGESDGLPDIVPGDVVTVETSNPAWQGVVNVKSMTAQHGLGTDQITGIVQLPTSRVELSGWQWWGELYPVAGAFDMLVTATTSFTGSPAGFDMRNGVGYEAVHRTADDYRERIYREADWIEVYPRGNGLDVLLYPPGTAYTITLYDGSGSQKAQLTGTSDAPIGNSWGRDFWGENTQIQVGDRVQVRGGNGFSQTVTVPDILLSADADSDLISGQGPANSLLYVEVQGEDGNQDRGYVPTNGSGQFAVTLDQLQSINSDGDLERGDQIVMWYFDSNNNRVREEFHWPSARVNYAHDWVGADYAAGHTFWITVTDSSDAFKASATLNSTFGGGWGADGFETEGEDWTDSQPDIQTGDHVYVESDDGYSNVITVGTISGRVDVTSDSISGTINVPGFSEALDVICRAWGAPGGAPDKDSSAQPDGSTSYSCSWNPVTEWDILPGQDVAVSYAEPDGDEVINVFQAPTLRVNYGHDWVEANYEAGHTVWITITDSADTFKATTVLTSDPIPEWGGTSGFATWQGDWSPSQPDIEAGDHVYVEVDDGYSNVITVGTISGKVDVADDSISGTVTANWFTQTLAMRCEVWVDNGPDGIETAVNPNGGSYQCNFADVGWDLLPGQDVAVRYIEPDNDEVINVFQAPRLRVNYGDDWVEANYEAGHTVWVTVTNSVGTVKATTEVSTGPIPDWGGSSGFATWQGDWSPDQPDILPGDLVKVRIDDGYSNVITVGTISGNLDVVGDSISGTITANWFAQTLDVRCEVWVNNGPDGIDTTAAPNGGSYQCNFADVGWDLLPGQTVAVQYVEPDSDQVFNTFRSPAPNLRVEKWVEGGGEVAEGGPVVFGIRYWNDGDAAGQAVLTDTLPASTTYASDTSGHTAFVGSGVITWNLGSVAPYTSPHQFQLVLTNNAGSGSTLHNEVEIGTPYETDWDNNSAWAEVNVNGGQPDLRVDKDANPGDPAPGQLFRYQINYSNDGSAPAGPVWLTDTLPAGTTFVSWESENNYSLWTEVITAGGQVVLYTPALPGNWGDRIFLTLRLGGGVDYGTRLTNTIEITAPGDDNPDNNSFTNDWTWASPPRYNVSLDKSWGSGALVPGGETYYNLNFGNGGNSPVHNAVMTDTLPSGVTFVEAVSDLGWGVQVPFPPDHIVGNQLVWDLGDLEVNAWTNLTLHLQINSGTPAGTVLTNCATISSSDFDDDPYDDSPCIAETVRASGPNLNVTKQANWEGSNRVRYDIGIGNIGTTTVHNVTVTDTYPAEMTLANYWLDYGDNWSASSMASNPFTVTLDRLEPGDRAWLHLQLDLASDPDNGDLFTNIVEVTTPPGDVYPGDNQAEVTIGAGPDLLIQKWVSGGAAAPGELLTYTLHFRNDSQQWWTAGSVRVTDTLPAGVEFVGAHQRLCDGEYFCQANPWYTDTTHVVWDYGQWGNGWWNDLVVTVRVADTAVSDEVLTNTAEIGTDNASDVEPDYDNNTSTASATVSAGGTVYLPIIRKNAK